MALCMKSQEALSFGSMSWASAHGAMNAAAAADSIPTCIEK
jgi:hypothetical protein